MNAMRELAPRPALPRAMLLASVRAASLYAVFAALWILLSDSAVEHLFPDPATQQVANTLKGMLFVAITTLLLFFLLMRFAADAGGAKVGAGETVPQSGRRMLFVGILLLAMVFLLLALDGARKSWERNRATAGAQLQTIARLKTTQLENWLSERLGDARMAGSSPLIRTLLPRWLANGDPLLRERLLAHLEDYRATYRYHSVLLCDAEGGILLRTGASAHGPSDELRTAVRAVLARGKPRMADLYRMSDPAPEHSHLDFVAPITPRMQRQAAAVVLRADVDAAIYSYLQTWPVPSASAETLLVRRDGDSVLYLNELRHRADTALKLRRPLAEAQLLEARMLAADAHPGALIEGNDYRGKPALGVALPITGTSWWLVAKADRDEVLGAAYQDTLWIALCSLLAWGVAVSLAALLLQQRELRLSQQRHREQNEQLRALNLLAAIADNSADAIFAKDRAGRYLIFNHAASYFTGKAEAEVLGHDDGVLFPPAQAAAVRANDQRVMDENRQYTYEETLETAAGQRTFLAVKGPLRNDDGEVIGMFGISRDISERASAEERLRHSNDELQRFNHVMVGRELEMVRLKQEINALAATIGRAPPYPFAAADAAPEPPPEPRP